MFNAMYGQMLQLQLPSAPGAPMSSVRHFDAAEPDRLAGLSCG